MENMGAKQALIGSHCDQLKREMWGMLYAIGEKNLDILDREISEMADESDDVCERLLCGLARIGLLSMMETVFLGDDHADA